MSDSATRRSRGCDAWLKEKYRVVRAAATRGVARLCASPLPSWRHVVVLAPHPDDEVLGCGQLMSRTAAEGGRVSVIYLSSGEKSHNGCCPADEVAAHREQLAQQATQGLNIPVDRHWLRLPDGQLSADGNTLELVTRLVLQLIGDEREVCLCVPHAFEGWSDHEAANLLGTLVAKQIDLTLLEYCIWFWYSMPYGKLLRCRWRTARSVGGHREQKQAMASRYLSATAPCGTPWVGHLPPLLVRSCLTKKEYFFHHVAF